ncbi:MAG TPA: hypothetical protein VFQ61_31540 [Polyangiaceae bacterium]|nr:hypothetical protein [Polyangiaceae bacterium]
MKLRCAYWLAFALGAGCASDTQDRPNGAERVVDAPEQRGSVTLAILNANRIGGSYSYRGETLRFEGEALDSAYFVTLEVRGMILSATIDASGASDFDAFKRADGTDTAMTAEDRALVHALDSALTEISGEQASELPALAMFNHALALWSDYPSTIPLRRAYFARAERTSSAQNLCSRVNKPGQGEAFSPIWTWASHDCFKVKGLDTNDCGARSGGCAYGDDSSTVENVFMSMHPKGGYGDGRYYGDTASTFEAYEPDHDSNVEFGYGNCFGRCGADCGGSSQFTQACLDHDLCVTFGHWTWNPLSACDDEFIEAAIDYLAEPDCGGQLAIDYDWAGSPYDGKCSESWNSSNDGCDVGCQFVDGDCFR